MVKFADGILWKFPLITPMFSVKEEASLSAKLGREEEIWEVLREERMFRPRKRKFQVALRIHSTLVVMNFKENQSA